VLMVLYLAHNLIALVDELEPLNRNPCLYQLELKGNPIRSTRGYHNKVFDCLGTLNILDRRSISGNKVDFSVTKKSREADIDEAELSGQLTTINELDIPEQENIHELASPKSRRKFKVARERTSG
jgi:hypothetical protein